jgi:hypothetical protein
MRKTPRPHIQTAIDTIADHIKTLAPDERAAILNQIGAAVAPEPSSNEFDLDDVDLEDLMFALVSRMTPDDLATLLMETLNKCDADKFHQALEGMGPTKRRATPTRKAVARTRSAKSPA